MLEVTKCAPQLAIKNLGKAFKNYFDKRAGYPQFHKKGRNDSFALSNDQFEIKEKKIRIPNLGWVRLTEYLRFNGKIIGAVVSRRADKWFVSVQVEMPDADPIHTDYCETKR
jgi:putative transposase